MLPDGRRHLQALHDALERARDLARDRDPLRPRRASAASARRIRSSSASGTRTPGTSLAMNSAFRALSNGNTPATTGSRADSMRFAGTPRTARRRRSAASARTRRPPRPCTRTAAAPRRGSTPPGSPTRRCETPSARRWSGRRRRSRGSGATRRWSGRSNRRRRPPSRRDSRRRAPGSPVMSSTLRSPIACAPSRSDWMPSRLRSRQA